MLITELKSKETIASLVEGKKVFIINCHGCKEVHFPEKEADELQKEMAAGGNVTGIMTKDYICNPENLKVRIEKYMDDQNIQGLKDMGIMNCVECRCCEFICSSKIPLVTKIKAGKLAVRGLK